MLNDWFVLFGFGFIFTQVLLVSWPLTSIHILLKMEEAIEAIKAMGITQDEGQIREVSATNVKIFNLFW